ncbi:Uncharacterised protein [Klebsiella pneumoniae]|nr:Uncharacterised protein [Klebsiella pneumoniae]
MMRELTAFEIENVSGAGWLQDGLAALGSKVGAAAWTMGTDALSINLPLLGTLNLADLAPDLGKNLRRKHRLFYRRHHRKYAGKPAGDRRPAEQATRQLIPALAA